MPRIPKYRRHKASGRAVLQYKPFWGEQRFYLPGAFNSTESLDAYEQWRTKIVEDIRKRTAETKSAAPRRPHGRSTVNELLYAFLDYSETHHGADGKKEHRHLCAAARPLKSAHGQTHLCDFGPLALKHVRQAMIDLGWSRQHTNRQVGRVRRIFRWAVENEWCDASVLAALQVVGGLRKGKTKAREAPPVTAVAWSVVERVLPYLQPVVRAMVEVQYLTGMRADELVGMRPCEIARDGNVWLYCPADHKTQWRGLKKYIPIGPKAQAVIAPYWPEDPAAFVFSPRQALIEKGRVKNLGRIRPQYFTDTFDKALAYGFLKLAKATAAASNGGVASKQHKPAGKSLEAWMRDLGLEHWTPHRLRHTRATMTKERYGVEGAQAQLGNTLDATELYSEQSVDLAVRIARETG